jgi:RNA polymerase sigma-70 factor (ECF subfamily)
LSSGWTGGSRATVALRGRPARGARLSQLGLPICSTYRTTPELAILTLKTPPFQDRVVELFHAHFHRLVRYLDRLSGDPELAADLAQEAFIKLYQRGSMPDRPEAWLITVAMNLFRNARSTAARRRRLLTPARAEATLGDPMPSPSQSFEGGDEHDRVRAAIDRLTERERQILLLRAEGYGYRDLAAALDLNEASIGTLLARAKRAFRDAYGGDVDAP